MKIIFWIIIAILWSPFELLQMFFTKEVSKIGLFIADKINFK
jgi:hypothetical protein